MAPNNKQEPPPGTWEWIRKWWQMICSLVLVLTSIGLLFIRFREVELKLDYHSDMKGHSQTTTLIDSIDKDLTLIKYQLLQQQELSTNQRRILDRLTSQEKDISVIQATLSKMEKSSEKRQ
jgi:preprotein translocase subunit SecF